MKKRILSLFLTLVMVLSLLPGMALAAFTDPQINGITVVRASGAITNEGPENLLDTDHKATKWCVNTTVGWVALDLGKPMIVTGMTAYHCKQSTNEWDAGHEPNTKGYALEVFSGTGKPSDADCADNTKWTSAGAETANTDSIKETAITMGEAKQYVRFHVTDNGGTDAIRVYGLELFGHENLKNPTDIIFAAGTGAGGTMSKVTVEKNSEYQLPANEFTAPDGMIFDGWSVQVGTGTAEKLQPGDKVTITEAVTVTALWKAIPKHTITFVKGHANASGTMASVQAEEGSSYTLPADGFTAPDGMIFDGWSVQIGAGAAKKLQPGDKVTITETVTVTALWRIQQSFTVSFEPGKHGSGTMSAITVKDGESVTMPECGFTAEAGYRFDRWDNLSEGHGAQSYHPQDSVTPKSDMTLTAYWIEDEIRINYRDSKSEQSDFSYWLRGVADKLPGCMFTAPEGEVFAGWSVKRGDQEPVTKQPGESVTFMEATTITAVWKAKSADPTPVQVSYVDGNGETKTVSATPLREQTAITGGTDVFFVAEQNTTMNQGLQVTGELNLILCDGCTLNINGPLTAASMNVYGQTQGTGKLNIAIRGVNEDGIHLTSNLNLYGGSTDVYSENQYGVYVKNGNATISGSASLNAEGDYDGLYVEVGDLTVSDSASIAVKGITLEGIKLGEGNLTVSGSAEVDAVSAEKEGIYVYQGDVTVSGSASVTAKGLSYGLKAEEYRETGGGLIVKDTASVSGTGEDYAGLYVDGFTAEGGTTTGISAGESGYGIYVGSYDMTVSGKASVTGTNDADYSYGICLSSGKLVAGDSTSVLGKGDYYGIYVAGNGTTVSGSAAVTGDGSYYGIYLRQLTASGQTSVTGSCSNGYAGICNYGNLTISGSAAVSSTAVGMESADDAYGLYNSSDISVSGNASLTCTASTGSATTKTYGLYIYSGYDGKLDVAKNAEVSVSATGAKSTGINNDCIIQCEGTLSGSGPFETTADPGVQFTEADAALPRPAYLADGLYDQIYIGPRHGGQHFRHLNWSKSLVKLAEKEGEPGTTVEAITEVGKYQITFHDTTGTYQDVVVVFEVSTKPAPSRPGNPTVEKKTETDPTTGVETTTVIKRDGTVVETSKAPDGSKAVTTTNQKGETSTRATVSAGAAENVKQENKPAQLPMKPVNPEKSQEIYIQTNTKEPVRVEIPVENVRPGMVPVIVKPDGTEEIVRKSAATENGVVLEVKNGETVKLVDNSKAFSDTDNHWAENAIEFTASRELFDGVGNNEFAPNAPMTRGMLAKVLHNLESNPQQAFSDRFTDVEDGKWFSEAVSWAAETGIISGYGGDLFGLNDNVTREQLVTMLWRYSGSPKVNESLNFKDADRVSSYARQAMQWAVKKGIINGIGGNRLDPTGLASRAQVAAVMMRLLKL